MYSLEKVQFVLDNPVISFPGTQAKLDLDVNSVIFNGTRVLSISAPFWMINKTGKHLSYRDSQDSQNKIFHPIELDQVPMMFSYTKRFMGKRKGTVIEI